MPPSPPLPQLTAVRPNSLSVSWTDHLDGGSPVTSYRVLYREQFSSWKMLEVGPQYRQKEISSLKCGTEYEVYMVAVNSVGAGKASPVVRLTTLGTFPAGPADTELLALNTSWVGLQLGTWSDGDCPISSFVIEYSLAGAEEWHLVSNNVVLEAGHSQMFTIYDLRPGTSYKVRITAHNSAGSSVNSYNFSTLPPAGPADTIRAGGAGEVWSSWSSWSSWSLLLLASLGLVTVSSILYLGHLTLHKLITKKEPSQQQNNQSYDQYDQYHEMKQLEPQESVQVTPAHANK